MIPGALLLAWAAVVAGASLTALRRWSILAVTPAGALQDPPPVTLVRPCAGAEPGLPARLASVRAAHFPGLRLSVRITVAHAEDPAWPIAQAAAVQLRAAGLDAEARIIPAGEAPNQKAAQLAGLAATLPADAWLINADSDVDLTGFDLCALLAPLAGAAGGAWAPPVERRPTTPGDRASQAFLNGSLHAFHLLGGLDPNGLVGKVMALRLDRFGPAGGFAGLERCLGEDMEIARRLRAAGHPAPMVAQTAPSEACGRSLGAVIARYARWLAVIRAQRPALLASYPLLFGATTPIVLLGLLTASPLGLTAAALALITRLAVAAGARRAAELSVRSWSLAADWLLGDLVTLAAFLQASRSRRVTWRGRRLTLGGSGELLGDGVQER